MQMDAFEKPLLSSKQLPSYTNVKLKKQLVDIDVPVKAVGHDQAPSQQLSKTVDPQPADEERDRNTPTKHHSPSSKGRSPILAVVAGKKNSASTSSPLKSSASISVAKKRRKKDQFKSATAIPLRGQNKEGWQKLENLTQLKEINLISQREYEERKQQLIDELTGTTIGEKASRHIRKATKPHKRRRKKAIQTEVKSSSTFPNANSGGVATVVPGGPPDWRLIKSERAIKHTFNPESLQFDTSTTQVKISKHPFARGALRLAYYMRECKAEENTDDSWSALKGTKNLVAKLSIDPFEEKDIYFQDVSMQALGQNFADKYNVYNPPKRVGFISSWVCQLIDRPMEIYCGVEQFIDGHYRKHNNNFGFVDEDERNTPQAFSHFTYVISDKKLLMCDIQGVCDLYTDPQLHTLDGSGFGKGNMGQKGMEQFVASHRCNPICRYLKLKSINPKLNDLSGTLPNARFMSYKRVQILTSVSGNYQKPVISTIDTPLLPPLKQKSTSSRKSTIKENPENQVEEKQFCPCFCSVL